MNAKIRCRFLLGMTFLACVLSHAQGKTSASAASRAADPNSATNESTIHVSDQGQSSQIGDSSSSIPAKSNEPPIYLMVGSGLLAFSYVTRHVSRRLKVRSAHTLTELHPTDADSASQ
jgi:hypothetical protein